MTCDASPGANSDIGQLLGELTVLVVEDSETMRSLLVALLQTMGIHHISCAKDGQSGLSLFVERQPDLVITDGIMAPMSGYAMTRAIRELREPDGSPSRLADVPILMLSGHGERQKVEQARDDGVTDYIVKPVTPDLLYARVIAAISTPIHIVETPTYRGPSPRRRLVAHSAFDLSNDEN